MSAKRPPQLPFTISDLAKPRSGEEWLARYFAASPGFFSALSIEPKAGRLFTAADSARSPAVAVINQSLVPGIAALLAPGRILANALFGVRPLEPLILAGLALLLLSVAMIACYLPARRATPIDPAAALRGE